MTSTSTPSWRWVDLIEIVELPQAAPEIPRNGYGQPMIVPEAGGKPQAYRRTTTYIDVLEDKSSIATWKQRMTLTGAALTPDVVAKAQEILRAVSVYDEASGLSSTAWDKETVAELLAEKDVKDKLNALSERAADIAGASAKATKGTDLHALSELVDAGQPLPESTSEKDLVDMAAYLMATDGFTFKAIEEFVVIPSLKVGGTPDRICHYAGPGPGNMGHVEGDFIWDLKTGNIEYGALKIATQLAAYSRARRYDFTKFPTPSRLGPDGKETKEWKEFKKTEFEPELAASAYSDLPPVDQDWGIVLHLPSGSGEAELYWANLKIGWDGAKEAARIHALRTRGRRALVRFSA